jgi:hypothetical protein
MLEQKEEQVKKIKTQLASNTLWRNKVKMNNDKYKL